MSKTKQEALKCSGRDELPAPAITSSWLRAQTSITNAPNHTKTHRCERSALAAQRRETPVDADMIMRGQEEWEVSSSVPGLAVEPLSTVDCLPSPWSWFPYSWEKLFPRQEELKKKKKKGKYTRIDRCSSCKRTGGYKEEKTRPTGCVCSG